ncbi:MAG: HAD-superfamily hydrolase, subfamily variant 3 [Clostridia bacterium]|nr:HAD-superfamily hydrolase, subfamily variant 3 [Clostridia bacterium]
MYQIAIFDLDGTLLNTLTDLANAGNYALRSFGLSEHPINNYKTYVGSGVYKLVERILPEKQRDDETVKKVKAVFETYYENHSLDHTRPYEGVNDLLHSLRQKGVHCAVASNKPHTYAKELVRLMFGETIEFALGQREHVPPKPDPTVVLEILDYFQMKPETCIYIGDSDVDMYTAKRAGVTAVGVAWGFRTEKELIAAGAQYMAADSKSLERLILGKEL